jgi:hypothetical protein
MAKFAAIVLLARRLKAAIPDAKHPWKAPNYRILGATGGVCSEYLYKLFRQVRVQGIIPCRGDEPPMTACGGNFIGGEISRKGAISP